MNKVKIYIISYFPKDDKNLRNKRKEAHDKQVEWLLDNTDLDIDILAQDYDEEDYRKEKRIKYYKYTQTNQGKARNILLEQFYKGDYDYAFFIDNDCILYEYYDGEKIFEYIEKLDFKDIDLFFTLDPRKQGFKKENDNNKTLYDNYLVFERCLNFQTAFFCLKNLKKYYNKEIYFKEMKVLEDVYFGYQCLIEHIKLYRCRNMILKEMSGKNSSIIRHTGNDYDIKRNEMNEKYRSMIFKDFQSYGLMKNRNGNFLNKKMYEKYNLKNEILISKFGEVNNYF